MVSLYTFAVEGLAEKSTSASLFSELSRGAAMTINLGKLEKGSERKGGGLRGCEPKLV